MDQGLHFLNLCIKESEKATASPDRYRVGAVIVSADFNVLVTGFTGEIQMNTHAEEAALNKLRGVNLKGATIYSSMEPCSQRKSSPKSCSQVIIEAGISRVVYALGEPSNFVVCNGRQLLIDAGIEVLVVSELADQVRQINSHLKLQS